MIDSAISHVLIRASSGLYSTKNIGIKMIVNSSVMLVKKARINPNDYL
jgi:hypothetical protein